MPAVAAIALLNQDGARACLEAAGRPAVTVSRGEEKAETTLHCSSNTTSFFIFFIFQNYSQFHMETSKTCNMKVVQTNKSYNFAFGVISKFQIFLKL
jgi:hypothetical protein